MKQSIRYLQEEDLLLKQPRKSHGPRLSSQQSGFVLVQYVIGFGIMGILMASIASFISYSSQAQRNLQAVSSYNQLITMAKLALKDSKSCTSSLKGLKVPASGAVSDEIKLYFKPPDATQPGELLAEKGSQHDRLIEVRTIHIRPKTDVGPNQKVVDLIIEVKKTGLGVASPLSHQPISVFATTGVDGSIVSCFSNYSNTDLSELSQKVCELMEGNEAVYNPATGECESRYEEKCFPGTADFASCGAGSVELTGGKCWLENYTTPIQYMNYTNGTSQGYSYPPGKCTQTGPLSVQCIPAVNGTEEAPGRICNACCKVDKLAL